MVVCVLMVMKSRTLLVPAILLSLSGLISCDNDDIKYVGCYDLTYSLGQNYHHHMVFVTIAECIAQCRNQDTRFAGIEKSDNFCYCGSDIDEGSINRDDSQCDVPCSDTDSRTCGGDWLMSLYEIKNETSEVSVVGKNVKFLVGISVGVRLYDSTNLDNFDRIATTGDWVHALDYHFAKNTVYIFSRGKLLKTSMARESTPPSLVRVLSQCEGFAVDWVHDKIYWMNCTEEHNTFMSMDLEDQTVQHITERPGQSVNVKRMEVDPYKGLAFWIADGTIESCTMTGKYFQTNMSAVGVSVRALTLDLQIRRVYYVGTLNQSSSLFSMDYVGAGHREHFSLPQLRSVYGLGLWEGMVYWVNYADVKDVLYTTSIEPKGNVQKLITIDKAVWHMKLVHEDIQKKPTEDPCTGLSCSHICVSNATNARCTCPNSMQLNLDEMTCSNSTTNYISTTTASSPVTTHKTALGKTFIYVGCFELGYSLLQNLQHFMRRITLEKCVNYCELLDSKYAGISANHCFCGSDIADQSTKREDNECGVLCTEDPHSTCGGEFLMSLYKIQGMESVVEEKNVRFLVSHNAGVVQYNATNVNNLDVLMVTVNWSYTIDCHVAKNLLFTYAGGKIFKTTLEPKKNLTAAVPTLVKVVSDCDGFAVDWVEDRIYWMDCSRTSNTIRVMDLEGSSVSTIMERHLEPTRVKRMEIDPYKRVLFWIADGVIESCSLSGNNFQTNVSREAVNVRVLVLDLEARRVFYVGTMDSTVSLMSVDYGGGAHKEHLRSMYMMNVYGLGLYNDHVYWVNYQMMTDTILRAPLSPRGNDSVQILKKINRAVWHFKLVHPKLQTKPRGDLCEIKGCSHSCRTFSSYSAVCTCPKGMTLGADSLTCRGALISVGVVGLSILLVLVIMLVAVVMVYLTDRYWSHLQLKLFNVPYTRTRDNGLEGSVTPVYDTTEDNVNLI